MKQLIGPPGSAPRWLQALKAYFLEQELEAKAKEVNERLDALADVEAWQEERAHLERALAWAPARILRADLEKNANLIDVLGPRELEQARLPCRRV